MNSRRPGGFTLLEMLIATAMVAMLAGSLYASLHIAFKARSSAVNALNTVRRNETIVELMRADLQAAMVAPMPEAGGYYSGGQGLITLIGPFTGLSGKGIGSSSGDTVSFYAAATDIEPGESIGDIKQIEYACDTDPSTNELMLVRRITTNLLATTVPQPRTEIIARNVRDFTLRYYDGQVWQDAWDSTTVENALPKAVEVNIQFDQTDPAAPSLLSHVLLVPLGQGTGDLP